MKLITAFEAAELRDRDNYPSEDINDLDLDQISQMIEEAAPYTNFITLKGHLPSNDKERKLIYNKYNVIRLMEPDYTYYTLIQWPEI
jgi:hypothetical protein